MSAPRPTGNPAPPPSAVTLAMALGLGAIFAGCQSVRAPVFPAISPPILWPPPPDRPRIQYIGELRGEESLSIRPTGWEAVKAVVAGPRPRAAFSRPTAVAVHDELVFVADPGLAVVHRLDLSARQYHMLTGAPDDPLRVPIDVVTIDGTAVVVDRGRAALDLFDLDGTWRATRRYPEITAPVAAAWDAPRQVLWIADAAAHACFPCHALRDLGQARGAPGSAPGQFNFPTAVVAHPAVGLVVADAMNFRIQVFDESGCFVRAFGQKGDAAGDFARPRDVAVDSEGHIYVLDNQFENVQVFDRDGRLLLAFGRGGTGPGEFSVPSGITIDERDRIWIADSYNRRVQVFQYLREESS